MFAKTLLGATLLASYAIGASAINTIEAVGAKFFYSNGTQFFIKGWIFSGGIAPGGLLIISQALPTNSPKPIL